MGSYQSSSINLGSHPGWDHGVVAALLHGGALYAGAQPFVARQRTAYGAAFLYAAARRARTRRTACMRVRLYAWRMPWRRTLWRGAGDGVNNGGVTAA